MVSYSIDNFNENWSRRLGCYGETEKAQGRTYGFGTVLFVTPKHYRYRFKYVPKTKSKRNVAVGGFAALRASGFNLERSVRKNF